MLIEAVSRAQGMGMRSVASEGVQTAPMGGRASPWSPSSAAIGRSLFAPTDGRFAPAPQARPSRPLGGFVPYAGHCIVPVKTNGLVRLPSFVRRNVSSEGPSIFLGLHASQNCLVGSSVRWWQQLTMSCDSHRLDGADAAERRDIPPPPARAGCSDFARNSGGRMSSSSCRAGRGPWRGSPTRRCSSVRARRSRSGRSRTR